jgi:GAF domain-containing protein
VPSNPEPPTDTLPDPPELASLRARVVALEKREAEHVRSEQVQTALYRIAEAATATSDLQAFYREIHATVATLMYADNFYIALYDDRREAINFPYYVDSVDLDIPDPNLWEPFGVGNAKGTTAYVLRTGRPELVSEQRHQELVQAGEIESIGVVGEGDWLGAPLKADEATVGVVVCQTYTSDQRYSAADRDLLAFVGQHIGGALTRVRALEETRQRNDELALVNEIGRALAEQLDFQAIIELVGQRVSELFDARSIFIALHDPDTNLISWPYDMDEGERFHRDPRELGPGMTSRVITTGRALRVGTLEEQTAAGAIAIGGSDTKSWLGVPITGANRVIGVLGLESLQANAYTDADERLLGTFASSMGVALENARLFDETKRLLGESKERTAELGVINEIGAALARQLEFQAIVDLVGERVRGMFEPESNVHRPVRRADEHDPIPVLVGRRQAHDPIRDRARRRADDAHHHDPPTGAGRIGRRGRRTWRDRPGWLRDGVVPRRADHERAIVSSVSSPWSSSSGMRTPSRTSACCRPSRRAWASRSRMHASSTRRTAS